MLCNVKIIYSNSIFSHDNNREKNDFSFFYPLNILQTPSPQDYSGNFLS